MQRFTVLDSWRGVCACFIALLHFNAFSHAYDVPLIRNASLFVDFFFVLSGFVIAAVYQERLQAGFGVAKFMLLRFGRLFPLHIVMLAAYVLMELLFMDYIQEYSSTAGEAFSGDRSVESIFTNIALIHGLGIHDSMTWNLPSWSISTGFYTYLIFALALVYLKDFFWLILIATGLVAPMVISSLSDINMYVTYDYGLIRNLYGFALGIFALHLYRHLKKTWDSRDVTAGQATLIEIVVVAVVAVFVSLAGSKTVSVIGPYLFAVTVIVFAFEEGALSRFLKMRPFVLVGTLSYSIYMVHSFVISRINNVAQIMEKTFDRTLFTTVEAAGNEMKMFGTELWHGDMAYVVALMIVIGVSYLTYRFIESPSRSWFRRLADRM